MYDADYSGECNPDSIRAYVYTKTTRGNPLDDIYEIDEYLVNGVDIYIYIYEVCKGYSVACIWYWLRQLFTEFLQ